MDSPLSSQLKAAEAIMADEASRCERVSRRYNERAFVILTDAFKWVCLYQKEWYHGSVMLSSLAEMLQNESFFVPNFMVLESLRRKSL